MPNTKNNRRFCATEERLEAAALAIMEEAREAGGAERLTVRAVCERAGVNRSTFYAHFLDVPDMVGRMEEHLGERLLARYRGGAAGPGAADNGGAEAPAPGDRAAFELSAASYVPFLEHIREHRAFYRIALATRRDFPLERGRDRMWDEVVVPRCRAAGIEDREQMTCLFVFYQAGLTMALRRWVDGGCAVPVSEMAATLAACTPRAWAQG